MDSLAVQAMCRTVQFVVRDWARTVRLIMILIVVIILYSKLAIR